MDPHVKALMDRIHQERLVKWGQETAEKQELIRQLVKREEELSAAAKADRKANKGSSRRAHLARLVTLWKVAAKARDAEEMNKRTYLTSPNRPS